jgi:hypothetical protein
MRIVNYLICKLYYNANYGIEKQSLFKFYLSKISVSLILLFWIAVLVNVIRTTFKIGIETSLGWYYMVLFIFIFYFLNKNTWTLSQVEDFISDDGNKQTLRRIIWVYWALLIIPIILLKLI